MVVKNHPYKAPKGAKTGPCYVAIMSHIVVMAVGFPGFFNMKIAKYGKKWETDSYCMVGAPNGGGMWWAI
jgi:hypothetical protein